MLSQRALEVRGSSGIAERIVALKASGHRVYDLSVGDLAFDTPACIKEACMQALVDGKTHYSPVGGIHPLREALAERYTQRGYPVGPSQVLVSPGAECSGYLSLMATCQAGDEVLIPSPYWTSYPEMVKLVGATAVFVKTQREAGFRLTAEALEAAITSKTRLIILSNPNNPSGVVYTREELESFLALALKYRLYILSDEIYEHFVYDGREHVSIGSLSPEAAACTVTLSGFSKTYAGWRLGTTVGPMPLIQAMEALQAHITGCPNTFVQFAALSVFTHPIECLEALTTMRISLNSRRNLLVSTLSILDCLSCAAPEGAFFLLVNVEALGMDGATFAAELLEQEYVAVLPGSRIGDNSLVRINYGANSELLQNSVERIARFCHKKGGKDYAFF